MNTFAKIKSNKRPIHYNKKNKVIQSKILFGKKGLPDSHSRVPPGIGKSIISMFIEKAFKEWCEIRQNIWTWRATCWYPSMNGKSGKRSTERQDLESPAGSAHFTLACVRRDQEDLGGIG